MGSFFFIYSLRAIYGYLLFSIKCAFQSASFSLDNVRFSMEFISSLPLVLVNQFLSRKYFHCTYILERERGGGAEENGKGASGKTLIGGIPPGHQGSFCPEKHSLAPLQEKHANQIADTLKRLGVKIDVSFDWMIAHVSSAQHKQVNHKGFHEACCNRRGFRGSGSKKGSV